MRKPKRPLPTRAEVLRLLSYDPDTGIFTWLPRAPKPRDSFNKVFAHTEAGTIVLGYVRIAFGGMIHSAHRLAWLIMTGEWPDGEIDHKNTIKNDNRWGNLRKATHAQNTHNRAGRSRKGLPKGVATHHSTPGRFVAQIKTPEGVQYLGIYGSPSEAHEAYRTAAVKYFGEFARFTMEVK